MGYININKVLNISNETIKKYLDTNNSFKDYCFYSVKIEDRNLLNLEFKELPSTNYRKAIWVYREIWEGDKLTL